MEFTLRNLKSQFHRISVLHKPLFLILGKRVFSGCRKCPPKTEPSKMPRGQPYPTPWTGEVSHHSPLPPHCYQIPSFPTYPPPNPNPTESPLPPTLLATLITALHARPFQFL